MTSRRRFLQIGITASAWPLASSAVRAAAGAEIPGAEPLPVYKVIYDRRFADSAAFADRAAALGLPAHGIDGDMTRFWYDELYHRWKQGPVAIAGLTAHGPMFCFEQLAHDQGMRVVFRVEHKIGPAGEVEHELSGPLSMLQQSLALNRARSEWPARMAEVVAQCPKGRTEISHTAAATAGARPAAPDSESLYSWVIAPAVRV